MKKQNQISEVAKKVAREIWESESRSREFQLSQATLHLWEDKIQSAIDAATAEVKKEKDLGSETHATLDVQREETGDTLIDFIRDNRLHVYHDSLHEMWIVQKPGQTVGNIAKNWSLRDALEHARYVLESEVPTQKAPTDTAVQKETATVSPAAPSRKQDAVIVQETAKRVCQLLGRNWESRNDVLAAIQEGFDAAARVEPTKEWSVFNSGEIEGDKTLGAILAGKTSFCGLPLQACRDIVAAHNASCAPTKEENQSL